VALAGTDLDTMERTRTALIKRLVTYPPRVIHDVDDVVVAVRLCEQLWPGKRITALRQAVEAEYRERGRRL